MERIEKCQNVKMFLLLSFLLLLLLLPIPFVSSPPLRSSYLYFLLNLLIIALAVEAGLLPAISRPRIEKKQPIVVARREEAVAGRDDRVEDRGAIAAGVVKKSVAAEVAEKVRKLKRCPSRPSIFFIGSCEADLVEQNQQQMVVVEEEVGELSKQELFAKAEMFIGNFYEQLKMQREESWKKLHGLHHKTF